MSRRLARRQTQLFSQLILPTSYSLTYDASVLGSWGDGKFHRLSARAPRSEGSGHRPVHAAAFVRIVARQVAHHSRGVLRRSAVRAAREARVQRMGRTAGAFGEARAHAHGRADDRGAGRRGGERRAGECGRASPSVRGAERERNARPLPRPATDRTTPSRSGSRARACSIPRPPSTRSSLSPVQRSRASVRREGHQVARDGRRSRSRHAERDLGSGAAGHHRGPMDRRAPS